MPVILPDPVTPVLEPDVFDGNPAYYRNFINTFAIVLDERNSFRPNRIADYSKKIATCKM